MKTKSRKPLLNMDERNKSIAYRVIAIMYFLTIIAMQGIVIYRQFALGQDMAEYEDIAIIMTINSLFLISALLYFGALPIRKLKIKNIIMIFIGFAILGSIFTYAKYNLLQSPALSMALIFDKIKIVIFIVGLILGFWVLLAYLGKRRTEKELE
jgi:hypothetical protein